MRKILSFILFSFIFITGFNSFAGSFNDIKATQRPASYNAYTQEDEFFTSPIDGKTFECNTTEGAVGEGVKLYYYGNGKINSQLCKERMNRLRFEPIAVFDCSTKYLDNPCKEETDMGGGTHLCTQYPVSRIGKTVFVQDGDSQVCWGKGDTQAKPLNCSGSTPYMNSAGNKCLGKCSDLIWAAEFEDYSKDEGYEFIERSNCAGSGCKSGYTLTKQSSGKYKCIKPIAKKPSVDIETKKTAIVKNNTKSSTVVSACTDEQKKPVNLNDSNKCMIISNGENGSPDYTIYFAEGSSEIDSNCINDIRDRIQSIEVSGCKHIVVNGHTDGIDNTKYNANLSINRENSVKALFTDEQKKYFASAAAGETGAADGVCSPQDRYVRVYVGYNESCSLNGAAAGGASNNELIVSAYTNIQKITINFKASKWKNAEGEFNTSRLISDSIAGVVLGTAGGLITSSVIKKNQIENGFEDITCTIGGQVVSSWGDEFTVK